MTLFDNFMGPIDKSYCVIFYGLGILLFIFALFALFSGIYLTLFKSGDKNARTVYISTGIISIVQSFIFFIAYYLYRIVYNICIKVL